MYGSCKPQKPPYLVTNIIMCWGDKYKILYSKDNPEFSINKYNSRQLIDLLSVRNKETNELSCMLHPGKGDMIILNHKETWQHKVGEWKSIPGKEERIVGCFDFNI